MKIISQQKRLFWVLIGLFFVMLCSGCRSLRNGEHYWIDDRHTASGQKPRIQFIVFHYTAENDADSLAILTGRHVSAHYLIYAQPEKIAGKPVVLRLVPETERAWHAGASYWRGRTHLNDTSIGIEIVNAGYSDDNGNPNWPGYSEWQIEALSVLVRDILQRYQIDPTNVVGHSDIAPTRKQDPGPAFPWRRLAQAGIGAWPDEEQVHYFHSLRATQSAVDIAQLQTNLKRYGYKVPLSGTLDDETRNVIRAFQQHFRPQNDSGFPDSETLAILDALLLKYRS